MDNEGLNRVRNHWYWRPGWGIGRRFYTWHLTFADQPAVVDLAQSYRELLDATEETDRIPSQWLHLTMQGVGFIDEVDQGDVDNIVEAARRRCANLRPFVLTIGSPYVDAEAVQINVRPPDPVSELRLALREAIAEVWGPTRVPEAAEPFLPHMSLAYINRDGPAAPLSAAVNAIAAAPVQAEVKECQLIVINRNDLMYKWERYASVALADAT